MAISEQKQNSSEWIGLDKAYTAVRDYCIEHIRALNTHDLPDDYPEPAGQLIEVLPEASEASEIEKRAVLEEVVFGNLGWVSNGQVADTTLLEVAKIALKPYARIKDNEVDISTLKGSRIWRYTTYGKADYYLWLGNENRRRNLNDDAEKMYKSAILESDGADYDMDTGTKSTLALAELHESNKDYRGALNAFRSVISLATKRGDLMSEIRANLGLGRINRKLGTDPSEAKKHLDRAEKSCRIGFKNDPDSFRGLMGNILSEQLKLYDDQGDILNASRKQAELTELVDTPTSSPETPGSAPTSKIESDHWATEDSLGYLPHARTIASIITHEETKPPLVIGIKAAWGAGKTSMMKMVQHMLDGYAERKDEERRFTDKPANKKKDSDAFLTVGDILNSPDRKEKSEPPPIEKSRKGRVYDLPSRMTVWFNAWKYQSSEQVWAGMAHAIISQVTERMTPANREAFWLKLYLKRVDHNKIRRNVYRMLIEDFLPKALVYFSSYPSCSNDCPAWIYKAVPSNGCVFSGLRRDCPFFDQQTIQVFRETG